MSRILLIDDDPTVRLALRLALEMSGYEVVEAVNGREGLAAFAVQPPDLVVTDLIMPEIEGVETIRALRKMSPTLPIIAISGGGRSSAMGYLQDVRLFGANEVFAKPFELDVFQAAITHLLGQPRESSPA